MLIGDNDPTDGRKGTEVEMQTARSQVTSVPYTSSRRSQDIGEGEKSTRASYFYDDKDQSELTFSGENSATNPSLDLLDRIKRMYRLLELVSDKGVSGAGKIYQYYIPFHVFTYTVASR
jgi:hypothetical protein